MNLFLTWSQGMFLCILQRKSFTSFIYICWHLFCSKSFSNSTPSILLHMCLVTKCWNSMRNALSVHGSAIPCSIILVLYISQDCSRLLPVQHSTQFLTTLWSQPGWLLLVNYQGYLYYSPFSTEWFNHFEVQLSSHVLNVVDQIQIHLNE